MNHHYETEDELLAAALRIAEHRLMYQGSFLENPQAVRDYLHLRTANASSEDQEREVFGMVWLTAKHQVITAQNLFKGTIDSANIYPREVVKAGLKQNAAACIAFHNHPSGNSDPSTADRTLTQRLKEALGLVDIRLLDHMVVGHTVTSLAEKGWL